MHSEPVIQTEIRSLVDSPPRRWRPTARPAWTSSELTDRHGADVSADELTALQQAFDRYEILDCLERGGQGVVYRARQKGSSRMVALKLLLDGPLANDRQRFRFEREIELISRLRHPNLVTLFDSGVTRGRPFYAMEFIDGLTIDDYSVLHDLPPRRLVELMVPVCRAIHYAHQNGVIHRDLKPAHILVDTDGQPRVFDFGLAKDLDETSADIRHSCTGLVVGTLPYLSPEQAGGLDGKSDVRSDVYALGVILFQLLAELFPYPVDATPDQVRSTIISTEPLLLRKAMALSGPDRALRLHEVNRDLESIVAKALRKEKDARYQSAAELADDLERYLKGEAVTARAGSRWYSIRKAVRKHRVATGVVATLFVATAGISAAWVETRAQRDLAQGAAKAAVDSWVIAVDQVETRIRALPGGYLVREELIRELLKQMPQLEAYARSDPRMSATVMKLLERKGQIELKLGMQRHAASSFQELLDRAQEPVRSNNADVNIQRIRVVASRGLALCSSAPAIHYEAAIRYGQESLSTFSNNDLIRREYCESLVEFGSYLKRCRQESRGLEMVNIAIWVIPTCAKSVTETGEWTRLWARALGDRGAMLLRLGRGAEGLEELYLALKIRENIAAACPADTMASDDLMCAFYRTAVAERERGTTEQAISRLESAAAIGFSLSKMDPTATTWDRNRFRIHHDLALLQMERSDLARARENCAIAKQLVERSSFDSKSSEAREDLAFLHILQGRLELCQDDVECAIELFSHAAKLRDTLSRQIDLPVFKQQLAASLYWVGYANRKLGRLDLARPNYERAVATYQQLSDGEFDFEEEFERIRTHINLAALLLGYSRYNTDDQARELLYAASSRLDSLITSKYFAGRERRIDQIESALYDNCRFLSRRDAERRSRQTTD